MISFLRSLVNWHDFLYLSFYSAHNLISLDFLWALYRKLHLPFPLLEIEIYRPLPSWYLPFGNTSNCFAFNRFMSSPVHNSVYKVGWFKMMYYEIAWRAYVNNFPCFFGFMTQGDIRKLGYWRRDRDSNPGDGFPPTHFPGVRLRPLGHLSDI